MKAKHLRRGTALAVALCTLLIVMLVAGAVVRMLLSSERQSRRNQEELQAQWLGDAALMRAAAQLHVQSDYTGGTWRPPGRPGPADRRGIAEIRVEQDASRRDLRRIIVVAHYPDHEFQRATAERERTLAIQPKRSTAEEKAP
jgi:type II secretory pathway component PulK